LTARAESGPLREGVPAREGVGEGVGVLTRSGTGELSVGCAPEDGGIGGVGIARGGVSGDGVVGRLWDVVEGCGNGERVRRAKEATVGVGVLRPECRGKSSVWPGGDSDADPRAGSAVDIGMLREEEGDEPSPLYESSEAFDGDSRMRTGGGTFSRGFGTRSAWRINRKSRPNS
jgi:hypothetical protein